MLECVTVAKLVMTHYFQAVAYLILFVEECTKIEILICVEFGTVQDVECYLDYLLSLNIFLLKTVC